MTSIRAWLPPSRARRGALDGLDDADMGAAATEIAGERLSDIGLARLLVLRQERGGLHDHAVDAVAALHRLRVDEGLLHRMRLLDRAEALQRNDLLGLRELADRRDARAHGDAVDVDRAGAALAEPAAEARPVQLEVVAQRIEQRHL